MCKKQLYNCILYFCGNDRLRRSTWGAMLLTVMTLTAVLFTGGCHALRTDVPIYGVVLARDDTDVAIRTADGTTTIDITSASGIGALDFTQLFGPYPERLVLRLHLNGLEHLRFVTNDIELTAAVGSRVDEPVLQSVRPFEAKPDGAPTEIGADSIYWLEITHNAGDGSMDPLVQGVEGEYFEIIVPAAITSRPLPKFHVEWVDFYRSRSVPSLWFRYVQYNLDYSTGRGSCTMTFYRQ